VERVPGLLHLGPRPTFSGFPPTVELHLLDWSGNLYGQSVRVEFVERLRGVEAFTTAEDLVAQMHRDAARGRTVLGQDGLSG
jgi:riboflavin kinase/FMN adenylyltransferase